MKVLHVTYSLQGGAGLAASEIVKAQRLAGIDAELVVASEFNVTSKPLSHPVVSAAAIADKYLISSTDSQLFTLFRGEFGVLKNLGDPSIDVINFHWTPGAVSLRQLANLAGGKARIVWTLHDMFPFTGGCHFSVGCTNYRSSCENCPQVRSLFKRGVVENAKQKSEIFRAGVFAVSPSVGMQTRFEEAVGQNAKSAMIPNPISLDPGSNTQAEKREPNLIFLAADVNDPRKGLQHVLKWWQEFGHDFGELVLVGRGSEALHSEISRIRGLGALSRPEVMSVMAGSMALIVASTDDNAPNTVAEAHANMVPIFVPGELSIGPWLSNDGALVLSQDELKVLATGGLQESWRSKMNAFVERRLPARVGQEYRDLYSEMLIGKSFGKNA